MSYIGTGAVARRYGKCPKTIERWIRNPPPGFPAPIKQNRQYLFNVEALEAYERSLAGAAAPSTKAA